VPDRRARHGGARQGKRKRRRPDLEKIAEHVLECVEDKLAEETWLRVSSRIIAVLDGSGGDVDADLNEVASATFESVRGRVTEGDFAVMVSRLRCEIERLGSGDRASTTRSGP
jgi:hypothetical protein